jgi:uncharacterized protein YmfQ (DUF2313 family)
MHIVAITVIGILVVCVVALLIINAYQNDMISELLYDWEEFVEISENALDLCEKQQAIIEKFREKEQVEEPDILTRLMVKHNSCSEIGTIFKEKEQDAED